VCSGKPPMTPVKLDAGAVPGGRGVVVGGGGIPAPAIGAVRVGGAMLGDVPAGGGTIRLGGCWVVEVVAVGASAAEASSSALGTSLEDMVVITDAEEEDGIAFELVTLVYVGWQMVTPPSALIATFVSETGPPLFKVTTAGVEGVYTPGAGAGFPSTSFINAR